jgi:hypothetical protein
LKEVIASTLKTPIPHMVENAHRNDGNTVNVGIISNKRNNFQTIRIGQTNFKQDHIGRLLLDFVNGTRPSMSNLGLKAGELNCLRNAAVSLGWLSTRRMVISASARTVETFLTKRDRQRADTA